MPVLDAERWIGEQLEALAVQTYERPWELLVVDNGCRDRSIAAATAFRSCLPNLRVVTTPRQRSLNHARNVGAREARGDLLAFCDADDVVEPGWLEALVAAAGGADIVGGTFDLDALNSDLLQAWRPDEPPAELPVEHEFLPFANGGNCAVWTGVARSVGWDEAFTFGSSDPEFCWRAQLADHTAAFTPHAVVRLRYRRTIGALARQYYGYGRSGAALYRRFRALGMQRDNAAAIGWWQWLARHGGHLIESRARRGNWIRIAAFRAGRLSGSVRARTLFL
jgi:glycosyltransferase involved in cell wall biosynthesis